MTSLLFETKCCLKRKELKEGYKKNSSYDNNTRRMKTSYKKKRLFFQNRRFYIWFVMAYLKASKSILPLITIEVTFPENAISPIEVFTT